MRKILATIICLTLVRLASGAELPATDAQLIKASGVPVLEQAIFVIGNHDVGYRFATSQPLDAVRDWYRKKLPTWSVLDKFGSWILYDGAPGAPLSKIMSGRQVSIATNEKLPEWHKLRKDMTTEVVIKVPK